MTTLQSMAVFYNIVIFYFRFGERITLLQFLGMMLMVCSVLFLSLQGSTTGSGLPEDKGLNTFMAIFCGLLVPVCLSLKHVLIKSYLKGYKALDLATDALLLEYIIYAIMACFYSAFYGYD